ncbi:uncharacterized protein LOC105691896 isoform X2 [Athalia rosae]|uniref:uncharacterized protein LOC105691896 isoform X2 n=1 Tax=Athalia rosae TaxID=37344 RepID=UPI002033BE1B|nr:uncharacterized protein LOC105691896 isoform X2 [Athalia rosae]
METAYLLCSTILLSHLGSIPANIRCSQIIYREEKSYRLIRSRARSTLTALSRRNVSDLKKCKEFAVAKKALAFNFGRRISDGVAAKSEYNLANCIALGCPEVDGFADLVYDLRFDYYSLYKADDNPLNGSEKTRTCVPTVGLFEFSDVPKDFTEARKDCAASGGTLAHIASPERTKLLPNLIENNLKTDGRAFVGLSRRGKGTIWKNEFGDGLGGNLALAGAVLLWIRIELGRWFPAINRYPSSARYCRQFQRLVGRVKLQYERII